jgi:hypothetical protein
MCLLLIDHYLYYYFFAKVYKVHITTFHLRARVYLQTSPFPHGERARWNPIRTHIALQINKMDHVNLID